MKKFIFVLILVFTVTSLNVLSFGQSSQKEVEKEQKSKMPGVQEQKKDAMLKVNYTCPMHAKVAQDKPGKCPECKMNLEKKEVAEAVYTCPMHSDVVKNQSGKCPKCKMALEKKEPVKKGKSTTI